MNEQANKNQQCPPPKHTVFYIVKVKKDPLILPFVAVETV